tara:strand:+ start:6911 stop:7123 length:213 start_codon:yes stop_codon:yes gene_type:complete
MDEIKSFEELIYVLQAAQQFLEDKTGKPLEELDPNMFGESTFEVGHFMGMRDCLMIVQRIMRNSILGEEE